MIKGQLDCSVFYCTYDIKNTVCEDEKVVKNRYST